MDDGTKCCLGIIVVFILVALFLFWPQPHEPIKTEINCFQYDADENGTGYLKIKCFYLGDNETDEYDLENADMEVNITYENNTTVKYNLVTDNWGTVEINGLLPGTYDVSARIIGNETYAGCTYHNERVIGEYVPISENHKNEYSDSSSDEYQTHTTTRYYWVYV